MAESRGDETWGHLSAQEIKEITDADQKDNPFTLANRASDAIDLYAEHRPTFMPVGEEVVEEIVEEEEALRPEYTSVLEQTVEDTPPEPVAPLQEEEPPEPTEYKRVRALPEKEDAELAQQQQELLSGLNSYGHSSNPEGGGEPLTAAQFEERITAALEGRPPAKAYLPGEGSHWMTKPAQALQEYSGWLPPLFSSRDSPETLGAKTDMYRPATSIPYYGQRRGFQRPLAWAMGREGFTDVREGEAPFITEALGLYTKPTAEALGLEGAQSSRELIQEAEAKIIETGKRVGFKDFEPLLITPAALQLLRLGLQRMDVPKEQVDSIPLEYVAPIWHRMRQRLAQAQAKGDVQGETYTLHGTARTLGEKGEKDIEVEIPTGEQEALRQEGVIQGKPSKSAEDVLKNAQIKEADYDLFRAVKENAAVNIENYADYARVIKTTAYAGQELSEPITKQDISIPFVYLKGHGWNIDLNTTHHAVKIRRYRELWSKEMARLEAEGLTPNQAVDALGKDEERLHALAESAVVHANKRIQTFLSGRSRNASASWYVSKTTPEYLADYFESDAAAPSTPVTPLLQPAQMKKFMGPWLTGLGLWNRNVSGAGDVYQGTTAQNISTSKLQEALRTDPSTVIGSWLTSWEAPESKDPKVIWESLWGHWGSREHYELITTGKWDLTERFYDLGDTTAKLLSELPGGDYIAPDSYGGKKALGLAIGIPWLVSPINPDPLSVTLFGAGKVAKPILKGMKLAQSGTTVRVLEAAQEAAAKGDAPADVRQAIGDSGMRKSTEILNIHDVLLNQEIKGDAADVTNAYASMREEASQVYQRAQEATREAKKINNNAGLREAERNELLAQHALLEADENVANILSEIARSELTSAQQASKAAGKSDVSLGDFEDVASAHKAIQSAWEQTLDEPLAPGSKASKRDAFKVEYQYRADRKALLDTYEESLAAEAKTYGQEVKRTIGEVDARQRWEKLTLQVKKQQRIISQLGKLGGAFEGAASKGAALAQQREAVVKELEVVLSPPKGWAKTKVAKALSGRLSLEEKWGLYLKNSPKSRPAQKITKLRAQLDSLTKELGAVSKEPPTKNLKQDLQIAVEALRKMEREKITVGEKLAREMEARWRRGDALKEVPSTEVPPLEVQRDVAEFLHDWINLGEQDTKIAGEVYNSRLGWKFRSFLDKQSLLEGTGGISPHHFNALPYDPRRGALRIVDPDYFYYSVEETSKGRPTNWQRMSYDDLYAMVRKQEEVKGAAVGPKSPPITFIPQATPSPIKQPSFKGLREEVLESLKGITELRDKALAKLAPDISFSKKALNNIMKLGRKLDDSSLQYHRLLRKAEVQLAGGKLVLAKKMAKEARERKKAFQPQLKKNGIKTPSEAQEALLTAKKEELAAQAWEKKLSGAQQRVLQKIIDTQMAHRALLRRGGERLEATALTRLIISMPELAQARVASLIGKGLSPIKAAEQVIEHIPKYAKYEGPGVKLTRIREGPAVAEARAAIAGGEAPLNVRRQEVAPEGWDSVGPGDYKHHGLLETSAVKTNIELGEKINELRTGEAVAKWLGKNAADADQRLIAKKIAPIVGDIPIMYVDADTKFASKAAKASAAKSLKNAKAVYVHPDPTKGFRTPDYILVGDSGRDADTVLHELLHAATVDRLDLGLLAPRSTEMGKAAREIHYLLEAVKADRKKAFLRAEKEAREILGVKYLARTSPQWPLALIDKTKYPSLSLGGYLPYRSGSTYIDPFNAHELITYGFTNRNFQGYLRGMHPGYPRVKGTGTKTPTAFLTDGWSTFVNAIRKLLALPKGVSSSLGNLIVATDKLLAAPYSEVPSWLPREGGPSLALPGWARKMRADKPENFMDVQYSPKGKPHPPMSPPPKASRVLQSPIEPESAEAFRVISPEKFREILETRYGKKAVKAAIKSSKDRTAKGAKMLEGDPRAGDLGEGPTLHEVLESTEEAIALSGEDVIRLQDAEQGLVIAASNFWLTDQNLALMATMQLIRAEKGAVGLIHSVRRLVRSGAVQNQDMSEDLRKLHAAAENSESRFYDEVETAILKHALANKFNPEETVGLMLRYMNGEALQMGTKQTRMGETFMNTGTNLWDAMRVNLLNNARWVRRTEENGKLVEDQMGELGLQVKTRVVAALEAKGITQLSVRDEFLAGRTPTPKLEKEAAMAWTQKLVGPRTYTTPKGGRGQKVSLFEEELNKILGEDKNSVFSAGDDAIPHSLTVLSKVWVAQDETIQSLASNRESLLLKRAFITLSAAPDLPSFMESMRRAMKFDPDLKQLVARTDQSVRAYHTAVLASGQAKIETQARDQLFRIVGPTLTVEDAKAMNAIITGDYTDVAGSLGAFDNALTTLINLGIPINRVTMNKSLKEGARVARKIERASEDPTGMNAFFPTDALAHFDKIMGKIEKEMEAAFEQKTVDRVSSLFAVVPEMPALVKGLWAKVLGIVRAWRSSVVTGLLTPNPRHWTNTGIGNFGQIWQEESIVEATKFAFLALPTNIPFVGRAYQDAMIKKANQGDFLGTYTAAIFNPHLQEFWNMPTKKAMKTYLTDSKGMVHNLQELRLRAAQDGILSTFEAERGLLKQTTVSSLTGNDKLWTKTGRALGDWNSAIARMMVYGEQRARTAFWLDKVLTKGVGYEEAQKRTFNALYDWKHGIADWEREYLSQLMTFWRWWSLAARRHAAALTEATTKPTLRELALGNTPLSRIRKQLQVSRSLDEFTPSSWEDDTQPEIRTRAQEWDALISEVRPWWAADRLGGAQRPMPLDHTYSLLDTSGKLYTHYVTIGSPLTSAEMHTYYLYMSSGIFILASQLANLGASAIGKEPPLIIPSGELAGENLAGIEFLTKPLVDMLLPLYQAAMEEQLGGYRTSWRTRPVSLGEAILIEKLGGPEVLNLVGADIHLDGNNRWRLNSNALQIFRTLPWIGSQLPTMLSNYHTAKLDMKDNMAKGMVTMLGNFAGFRKVPTNPADEVKWEMKKIERYLKEELEAAKLPTSKSRISDIWEK